MDDDFRKVARGMEAIGRNARDIIETVGDAVNTTTRGITKSVDTAIVEIKRLVDSTRGTIGGEGAMPLVLQGDYSVQGSQMTAEQWMAFVNQTLARHSRNIVVINGDVYGFEDFSNAVASANADILRRGGTSTGVHR
jgi:hypothetical protein